MSCSCQPIRRGLHHGRRSARRPRSKDARRRAAPNTREPDTQSAGSPRIAPAEITRAGHSPLPRTSPVATRSVRRALRSRTTSTANDAVSKPGRAPSWQVVRALRPPRRPARATGRRADRSLSHRNGRRAVCLRSTRIDHAVSITSASIRPMFPIRSLHVYEHTYPLARTSASAPVPLPPCREVS